MSGGTFVYVKLRKVAGTKVVNSLVCMRGREPNPSGFGGASVEIKDLLSLFPLILT